MTQCTKIKSNGQECKAHAITGSNFCWFHSGAVKNTRKFEENLKLNMSRAIVSPRRGASYEILFGSNIGLLPKLDRLYKFDKFYDDGGLIATAIDSYINVAVANGYQLIDSKTGERETTNTDIIEELDERIHFHKCFVKMFRSLLLYGFVWGEIQIKKNKITKLLFLAPYECQIADRNKDGTIKKINQFREGKIVASWSGDKLKDVFFFNGRVKHSEAYGQGLLERVYTEAKAWKEQGKDLGAVTKFVAYPFRVVKVGSDIYPASEASVISIGDEVEKLEPGDWLATRHNLEFEFHAPKVPETLILHYKETTRQLIVSLGVPSMYTALDDVDANTLKEIRSIFNSTVQSMQASIKQDFEQQIIKRQFDLLGKLKKRTDKSPVQLAWNPLTVAVLSILELTQLVAAGVIGLGESRRILESMGYGLLRGELWKDDLAPGVLKAPKESHPTDDEPDKPPVKPPQKDTDRPPIKKPADQPTIKRPQPNAPKMTYDQWLQGIEKLIKVDKFKAYQLLAEKLSGEIEWLERDE